MDSNFTVNPSCQYSDYAGNIWPPVTLPSARGKCDQIKEYDYKCIIEKCPGWDVVNNWYGSNIVINLTIIFAATIHLIILASYIYVK